MVAVLIFSHSASMLSAQNSYTNSTYGFSIDFPTGWTQKSSKVEHTIIKATNSTSTVITYCTIAGYPVTTDEGNNINNATTSKAFQLVKTKFGMDVMTLQKTGDATIAGINMHWCTANFDMMGKTANCKTYYFAKNENLFRFTFCCDGSKQNYDDGLKLFEASLETFKFY